jgi:hypothetical protein
MTGLMSHHWVIVRRDRPQLFYAMCCAFMKRPGYTVVLDRREMTRRRMSRFGHQDRRSTHAEVQPFAIMRRVTSADRRQTPS